MQSFMGETVPEIVRDVGAEAERYRESTVIDFVSEAEQSGAHRHIYSVSRHRLHSPPRACGGSSRRSRGPLCPLQDCR
jgi:hypothetical protein